MYPPTISASHLMAEAGWDVIVLASPFDGSRLRMPTHPSISVKQIPQRPSYVVRKSDFLRYMTSASALALSWKPDVVYASDPLGAAPGLMAARLAGARLVYHEHDSPNSQSDLNMVLALARRRAARAAAVVVFPNAERGAVAQRDLGFAPDKLRIVWNVPRRFEVQSEKAKSDGEFTVYYHGTIVPDRLPLTVPEAVKRLGRNVKLRIVGYETASGYGRICALKRQYGETASGGLIDFIGQIDRSEVLARAAEADVGLALMSMSGEDINMRYMVGASNKAFDYMAAGLPLIVSDLQDWNEMFVDAGYARACNPNDVESVLQALRWFLENPSERRAMGERGRTKIETEWNYERQFAPVLDALVGASAMPSFAQ